MTGPRQLCLLILIIWLGFALRLHDLGGLPLRGDEAYSAMVWAGMPLGESLRTMAPGDPHPPLAYALFRAWQLLLGHSDEFTLRYLPLLGNLLGMPLMLALGARLSGSLAAGMLAAALWALHPYLIWHSQEFRNYAIWAGGSALSFWLGLRLIQGASRRRDWWLYGLAALAAALLFYAELLFVAALGLAAICLRWRDWHFLRRFAALQGAVAATTIATLLLLQGRALGSGAYTGNLEAFDLLDYLRRFLPSLLLGETLPGYSDALGMAISVILLALLPLLRVVSRPSFTVIACWLLVPLLLLGLVSQRFAIFNPRYALAAAPAVILLLVIGAWHVAARVKLRLPRPLLTLMLLLPWCMLALRSIDAHYNHSHFRKSPAWDELGDFLNANVSADELVIQLAVDAAFGYYYAGAAPDVALPVSPLQSRDEIAAALEVYRRDYASIYVAAREQAGWGNAGAVDAWLAERMQLVMQADAGGLPIKQYMPWTVTDAGEAVAYFDNVLALLAGEHCPRQLPGGDWLLRMNWRIQMPTAEPLKTFAHVYAPSGALLSQADHFPQAGRLDSRTWSADEVFREVYLLPSWMQAGEAAIHVGWYDPQSGDRLTLDAGGDSLLICRLNPSG